MQFFTKLILFILLITICFICYIVFIRKTCHWEKHTTECTDGNVPLNCNESCPCSECPQRFQLASDIGLAQNNVGTRDEITANYPDFPGNPPSAFTGFSGDAALSFSGENRFPCPTIYGSCCPAGSYVNNVVGDVTCESS
jgi:hypothetical protein